jgi:Putative  PD-(D/E)XK family member, (DUF4420)
MKMKARINEIWQQLSQQKSRKTGHVKTSVDSALGIPVFLALVFPTRQRALLIGFPDKLKGLVPETFEGRGMTAELLFLPEEPQHLYFMLTLTDSDFSQVFDVFLDDCLNAIKQGCSDIECLRIFAERLQNWRELFESYSQSGLSPSAQQGLFGELVVLLHLIKKYPDKALELARAWRGPERFRQDFQYNDWAIEVKTTTGSEVVTIANETQLSTFGLNYLFLWHFILDTHTGQGPTLNDLVLELSSVFFKLPEAKKVFETRLTESGYFQHQSPFYEKTGYYIRQKNVYNIGNGFPALTPDSIPIAISGVRYTVNLSACTLYLIPENAIYLNLNL